VKIIESRNFKSFSIHPQTETPVQHCSALPERAPNFHRVLAGHCLNQLDIVRLPPDFVRNLNLSPTARFLRELYIYPYTSNGSTILAFAFSC
jgi:hypothetical protein